MRKTGALALASGEVFYGTAFGAQGEAFGEAVFNTSMSGYQEILTDPSYKSQIITMTYPEIGNYGINAEDNESDFIHAAGFIVKRYSKIVSNFRATGSLADFLKAQNIIALEGIDTRKLTRILRISGSQKAVISTTDLEQNSLIKKALKSPDIVGRDLVKEVTTKKIYTWDKTNNKNFFGDQEYPAAGPYRVAIYDFGIKRNILRCLSARGCLCTVYPADTPPQTLLNSNPDGIFLSNGPGDPAAVPYAVENVKQLLGEKPLFGICFGHQIIGQALGQKTKKLKFGHRGANQPVMDLTTKKVEISSQNHGFVVDDEGVFSKGDITAGLSHRNENDQTLEGLCFKDKKVFSVQYHPEASPGPHDSYYLFDRFIELIKENS